jgi:cell division transport system permease protein
MKFFRILGRNIRDSFRSVFRNFALSVASISCITITLIVVAVAIILSYNVNSFATNVEKDVTIVTFLDVDITPEETDDVEDQINNLDYIETYRYESKTKIAEDMMSSSEVFTNIMKDWNEEESPIQSTFLVKVTDIDQIGEVAQKINAIEHVSAVKYGEGMIEQLVSVFEIIKQVSIGTVIALILVTAFLISNTIKITIFSRKREIEIMRLVGASNINIKIPFIFEGLFLGILGSVIPIIATVYGYVSLYENFSGQLFSPFIKLLSPQPFVFSISGVLILIGVAVGMFGSWRAVRKHLSI